MSVGNISSNINSIQQRSGSVGIQRRRVGGGDEIPQLIQALRAKQAFEKTVNLSQNKQLLPEGYSEEDVKLSVSSINITLNKPQESPEKEDEFFIQNQKYVGDIKNFINKNNYEVKEEEDIYNAIRNGKSLLADYVA